MKKNSLLLAVIFLLVIITYFVKEKDLFNSKKIFTLGELDSYQTMLINNRELVNTQKLWTYPNDKLLLDQKKIDHLFDILSHIETQDTLETNPINEVLYEINFKNSDGSRNLKILQFSNITGRLTIELDKVFYRAVLGHSTDGLFQSELNLQARLYSEFKYYLDAKENLYKDNYFYPAPAQILQLQIKDDLIVDLENKTTKPQPFSGISYKADLSNSIERLLKRIQITGYLEDNAKLESPISWISYNNKKWLTLYSKADMNLGAYLYDHILDKKFKIKQEYADLFFLKPSFFWNLQPITEDQLTTLNEATLVLTQKDESLKLEIPNTQSFELKVPEGISINQGSITELFKLLFAVEPYEQAYKVSLFNDNLNQYNDKLRIDIANKKFIFWIGSGLINLLDLDAKLVFSYVDNGAVFSSDNINQFLE